MENASWTIKLFGSEATKKKKCKPDISSILTEINKKEINNIEVEEDTFDDFELAQLLIFN